MSDELKPAIAYAGPLDGRALSADWGTAVVVMLDVGKGFAMRLTKPLIDGRLPKRYRDDPQCLGHYVRVRNMLSQTESYLWKSINVVVRSWKDKLRDDLKRKLIDDLKKLPRKKDQKPGWMLNGDELDQDYYGDSDPADDWKK